MQRRSFLAGLMAIPLFGAFKTPKPTPEWKKDPIDLLFVGEYPNGRWVKDPFIKVNLDNGPVTVDGMSFSSSSMMNEKTIEPTESSIAKLRNILKTNGGTVELIWGPDIDIFQSWVKIRKEGADHSYLIPLDKDEHSKSSFINAMAKDAPRKFANNTSPWVKQGIYDLMTSDAKFYHIVKGNQSNLWATGVEA